MTTSFYSAFPAAAAVTAAEVSAAAAAASAAAAAASAAAAATAPPTAFKVGSFTRDVSLASGAQVITGVGFQPKAILFLTNLQSTASTSWGAVDASSAYSLYDDHAVTPDAYAVTSAAAVLITSGSNAYAGYPGGFAADGFTMNWIKTGSPTGTATVIYMAFK